jgi:hypothetical protein
MRKERSDGIAIVAAFAANRVTRNLRYKKTALIKIKTVGRGDEIQIATCGFGGKRYSTVELK